MTQTLNVLTGGDPDETFSSRLGKAKRNGNWFAAQFCRALTWVWKRFGAEEPKGHCIESIEEDEGSQSVFKK